MCGIAGILYKSENGAAQGDLGSDLITMLDGCQHRGPDSTGFALYHEATENDRLRLRFFVGEGEEGPKRSRASRERWPSSAPRSSRRS